MPSPATPHESVVKLLATRERRDHVVSRYTAALDAADTRAAGRYLRTLAELTRDVDELAAATGSAAR